MDEKNLDRGGLEKKQIPELLNAVIFLLVATQISRNIISAFPAKLSPPIDKKLLFNHQNFNFCCQFCKPKSKQESCT
jgi:hypothetical protein